MVSVRFDGSVWVTVIVGVDVTVGVDAAVTGDLMGGDPGGPGVRIPHFFVRKGSTAYGPLTQVMNLVNL
jgi:hypothetical protein